MKKSILLIISLAVMLMIICSCAKKANDDEPLQKMITPTAVPMSSDMIPDAPTENNSETAVEEKIDYLVLVNKENKLPDNWEDIVELAKQKNDLGDIKVGEDQDYIRDREFEVEKTALKAFNKLQAALKEDGIIIFLDSTYRSVARQQEIWDEYEEKEGKEYVQKYVAVPGYSEHHTGLAIDICIAKNGKIINDNDEMLKQKKTFAKIHERLAEFGFILRYPDGKDDITGYSYEPWHFRYVGKKAAQEISSHEMTLEEYLTSGAFD